MFLLSQLKFVSFFIISSSTVQLSRCQQNDRTCTFEYSLVSHAGVFIQLIPHFKSFIIVLDDPFHTH